MENQKNASGIAKKFLGMFALGALLLVGTTTAAIVAQLALSLLIGGSVSAPFTTAITAVSVGTIDDPQTVSGMNAVAGSAQETVDLTITNNANQNINGWLEFSCGSADDSLTKDYIEVDFDSVGAQYTCDAGNRAYAYRTFAAESFMAATTTTPEVEYSFPITGTGYFVGNFDCEVNIATVKAC